MPVPFVDLGQPDLLAVYSGELHDGKCLTDIPVEEGPESKRSPGQDIPVCIDGYRARDVVVTPSDPRLP